MCGAASFIITNSIGIGYVRMYTRIEHSIANYLNNEKPFLFYLFRILFLDIISTFFLNHCIKNKSLNKMCMTLNYGIHELSTYIPCVTFSLMYINKCNYTYELFVSLIYVK